MRRLLPVMGAIGAMAPLAGVGAGPASAEITAEGIGGVHVGMDEGTVVDRLGHPSAATGREGPDTKRLDYRRRKLDVLLHRGQVIRVRTTSSGQRTRSGVGPGTSQRAMLSKLRGERCGTAQGARVCWVLDGATVLSFTCRRGRVTVAEVARAEL